MCKKGERGGRIMYWGETGKPRRPGEWIEICRGVGWGVEGTTRNSQTPGMWEAPRTHGDDIS